MSDCKLIYLNISPDRINTSFLFVSPRRHMLLIVIRRHWQGAAKKDKKKMKLYL